MPSIVELLERLGVMEQALARANERIEALEAENAELRRRLGQTPKNSNMPPSTLLWPRRLVCVRRCIERPMAFGACSARRAI
jgi:hypothetical protein